MHDVAGMQELEPPRDVQCDAATKMIPLPFGAVPLKCLPQITALQQLEMWL